MCKHAWRVVTGTITFMYKTIVIYCVHAVTMRFIFRCTAISTQTTIAIQPHSHAVWEIVLKAITIQHNKSPAGGRLQCISSPNQWPACMCTELNSVIKLD